MNFQETPMSRGLAAFLLASSVVTRSLGGQALGFDLSTYRMVDLTHPFNAQTIYWPNAPSPFKLQQLSFGPTPGGWFYSSYAFSALEHGGTHFDAPIHFSKTGITADKLSLIQLVAPA